MQKALAVTSIACSALTWLGVLVMYTWTSTESEITFVLLLAAGAFISAIIAVVIRIASPLAWVAMAASLVFPIAVWEWLQGLHGDVFG